MTEGEIRDHILRCRGGDSEAFTPLLKEFQLFAYNLAMRLLCDEEEALDAVQEAFVRAWKKIHSFKGKSRFSTWLYRILTNECMDRLRSKANNKRLFVREHEMQVTLSLTQNDIDVHVSNDELAGIIQSITDSLPPTQKLIFTLRDLQSLSMQEVCEITGLTAGNVRTNLCLARKKNPLDTRNGIPCERR